MTIFSIEYHTTKQSGYTIWVNRIGSTIGGLAIITIAILALPFTLLLFLWIKFRPKSQERTPIFPKHKWETIIKKEGLQIDRLKNDRLIPLAHQSPELTHDLEVDELVAFSIRTNPDIKGVADKFFDHPIQEAFGGLFLLERFPLQKGRSLNLYFLNYQSSELINIRQLPSSFDWKFVFKNQYLLELIGKNDVEIARLSITIK